jgi:ribosomal protein L20A (L18A)
VKFSFINRGITLNAKIFRIEGKTSKPSFQTSFQKEIKAMKSEDAIERVYAEIGSHHRVKRVHIKILSITEIQPEEAKDIIIRKLSEEGREQNGK